MYCKVCYEGDAPLSVVLRQAADRCEDAVVRRWLLRLLSGDRGCSLCTEAASVLRGMRQGYMWSRGELIPVHDYVADMEANAAKKELKKKQKGLGEQERRRLEEEQGRRDDLYAQELAAQQKYERATAARAETEIDQAIDTIKKRKKK